MYTVAYTVHSKWLHLYSAFIQSALQRMPLIHPFTHTLMAVSYHARCWPDHREQFGVQYLAKGHFDMQTGGAGDQTSDLLIRG